jgi:hypothetical protein
MDKGSILNPLTSSNQARRQSWYMSVPRLAGGRQELGLTPSTASSGERDLESGANSSFRGNDERSTTAVGCCDVPALWS